MVALVLVYTQGYTTHIRVVYIHIRDVRRTLNDCNYSFTYPNRDLIEVFWNNRPSSFDLPMTHYTFLESVESYAPNWTPHGRVWVEFFIIKS
jgi:hypothetical protein